MNQEAIADSDISNTFVASATSLPFSERMFDKAFSIHVLEHIPDLDRAMRELGRVVKPNGLCLHVFPAYFPLWPRGFDGALLDGFKMTRNPIGAFRIARELHVHKLTPKKLMEFSAASDWQMVMSERIFVREEMGYSWIVLLRRV